MFICNNVDNNGVLRVRFLKLNVYSSSKACPLALMQRVARVTMQSKERWIVCWSMLRHSVTIHEAVSNCWVAHHAARSKFCDQFVNTVEQNPAWFPRSVTSIRRSNFQLKFGNKHKECQQTRSTWRWHPATNPEAQQPCFSKF